MNYIDRKERQKYPARDLLISNSRLASCIIFLLTNDGDGSYESVKHKKTIYVLVIASVLSGCVSEEERLARCEAKGVSRDVCYQVDRANQQMIASNAQQNAYANARAAVKQHAQAAKKKASITMKDWKSKRSVPV